MKIKLQDPELWQYGAEVCPLAVSILKFLPDNLGVIVSNHAVKGWLVHVIETTSIHALIEEPLTDQMKDIALTWDSACSRESLEEIDSAYEEFSQWFDENTEIELPEKLAQFIQENPR